MAYLVEFILALLGVVDGWVVAVLGEMARCDEAVAAWAKMSMALTERAGLTHRCSLAHRQRGHSFRRWAGARGRLNGDIEMS